MFATTRSAFCLLAYLAVLGTAQVPEGVQSNLVEPKVSYAEKQGAVVDVRALFGILPRQDNSCKNSGSKSCPCASPLPPDPILMCLKMSLLTL